MRANQLRLWLSRVAYVLVKALRERGLQGTQFEKAQCDTIRLKLFKIGAMILVTVRRVWVSFPQSYPYTDVFIRVFENLQSLPHPRQLPAPQFFYAGKPVLAACTRTPQNDG